MQFLGPVFGWGLKILWATDVSWNYFLCPWSNDFRCKAGTKVVKLISKIQELTRWEFWVVQELLKQEKHDLENSFIQVFKTQIANPVVFLSGEWLQLLRALFRVLWTHVLGGEGLQLKEIEKCLHSQANLNLKCSPRDWEREFKLPFRKGS